jgi:poly-gamma-glutamate capsule biosynthesis protein CapA/YwtB (metallophosphatase superfamily)
MRAVLLLPLLLTLACTRAPAPKSARLWLAGDVFLGAGGHAQLADLPGITGPGAGIVNLEGPIAPTATEGGEVRLVHGEAALTDLAAAGVRVAGIANNHAHDAGTEGIARTFTQLQSHGIQPAGVARLQVDGLRVVVTAHDLQAGVPPDLLTQLQAAKRQGDVLVATFHVTGPASYLPRPELREAVAISLHAGALVVAAHGTHALGPVERRGAAIIAWGLGNLAFACECTEESEAMLLRVTLDATRVLRAEVVPIDAGLHGQPTRKARDPLGILDLLDGLGGTKLLRHDGLGTF